MRRVLPFLLFACLPFTASAADAPASDLDHFMGSYYQHPAPEKISQAMAAFADSGYAFLPNQARPALVFFSLVFAANPARMGGWQKDIGSEDAMTKSVLQLAALYSRYPGWVLQMPVHSANINDMYWAGFYATGDVRYLQKLMDQLVYCDERSDAYLFMVGVSAQWSLASNAGTDPAVKQALERAKAAAAGHMQALLAAALEHSPQQIKDDSVATLKAGKQAGTWKDPLGWQYTASQVLGVQKDAAGKPQLFLDMKAIDYLLDQIGRHTLNYPPKFGGEVEQIEVMNQLDQLLYVLDVNATTDADSSILDRAALANTMAYNVDMPGAADEADALYQTLLKRDPKDVRANYGYGHYLGQTGTRARDAIPYLLKARELGELRADYTLGYVYATLQDKDDAVKYLERYVAEVPADQDAKTFLDAIEHDQGKLIH